MPFKSLLFIFFLIIIFAMLNERKKNINYNNLKGINQKSQCFEVIKLIDASEIEAI